MRIRPLIARGCREGNGLALRWDGLLKGKVPRSLAKQIVMTKAYSATHKSLMDDVDGLLEQINRQGFAFAREERPQVRAWLTKLMKAAISDRIGSAERIMKWLQQTAAIVARHVKKEDGRAPGLRWRVPTGWPWVMAYGAKERRNAHARIGGVRATALVHAESDRVIDKKRQTGSISPNVTTASSEPFASASPRCCSTFCHAHASASGSRSRKPSSGPPDVHAR